VINALIVVYRESFEALLIVGLLYSFLVRQGASKQAFRAMLLGVIGGVLISALLALGIHMAESEFEGKALDLFQFGMIVLAVFLITHMCIWMRVHGRTLKSELEQEASKSLQTGKLLSLGGLTAIAVGREGSETVIFLYGLMAESLESGKILPFIGMALGGLFLGFATWFAFQKGFRYFSQKAYFTFSTVLLFITAGSMTMSVASKMIEFDWIPFGREELWDSSWLLSTDSKAGSIIQLITGYQDRPSAFSVGLYAAYWIVALTLFYWAGRQVPASASNSR
jgi:high-affinity iron transporter